MASNPVRVGIIGCGEATQVIHIPVLNQLYQQFQITYLCSTSSDALEFCSQRTLKTRDIPVQCTSEARNLCSSPDVDVVFVVSSDALHPEHAKLALAEDKHVFVEKPMAMSVVDAEAIIEAEKSSKGKVFVGYMRRYAAGFHEIHEEIQQLGQGILYARVRDIIGPNETFVEQSSTFPQKFNDYPPDETEKRAALLKRTFKQALEIECGLPPTEKSITQYQNLCGLGSHDLSAMREVLGMPTGVIGASLGSEFWNVLFQYQNFTVSYESGFHNIPMFDAHIEVYGENKSVRIQWENPFVRGLPVSTTTRERIESGGFKETHLRKTYEDPFILELKELHAMVADSKLPKTSAKDALLDLHIWQSIMRAAYNIKLGGI